MQPSIINYQDIPIAANVCQQALREIVTLPSISLAHVVMEPNAESLLHEHHVMHEIYYITQGERYLLLWE